MGTDNTQDTSANTPAVTDAAAVVAVPTEQLFAAASLTAHLEAAGKAELAAIKPIIGKIVRQYVESWEQVHTSGFSGLLERKVIASILDAIFGPVTA